MVASVIIETPPAVIKILLAAKQRMSSDILIGVSSTVM
jgi:hypothetical protein